MEKSSWPILLQCHLSMLLDSIKKLCLFFFFHFLFTVFKVAKLAPVYKRIRIVVTFTNFTVVCWRQLVREQFFFLWTDLQTSETYGLIYFYMNSHSQLHICFRGVNGAVLLCGKFKSELRTLSLFDSFGTASL